MKVMKLIPKTNQEAFDMVVAHLKVQKVPAMTGKSCRYRALRTGFPTLKCGIGCLIPDDQYDPEIDLNAVAVGTAISAGYIDPGDLDQELLKDLQIAHDQGQNWGGTHVGYCGWKFMRELATSFGLDASTVPL